MEVQIVIERCYLLAGGVWSAKKKKYILLNEGAKSHKKGV